MLNSCRWSSFSSLKGVLNWDYKAKMVFPISKPNNRTQTFMSKDKLRYSTLFCSFLKYSISKREEEALLLPKQMQAASLGDN